MIDRTALELAAFSRNTAPIHTPLLSGTGARVVDVDGNDYIDCCAQTLNSNLGQCHPAVVEAVVEQVRRLTSASSRFGSDVSLELHEKLVEITPEPLTKVNLASVTGSAANECALKAARKKTGRELVVSLVNSHHGQTVETMRASGKHWDSIYLGDRRARFIPAPDCARCGWGERPGACAAECLEPLEVLAEAEGENIAAVLVEPIMVDAGVVVPPPRYHERLRELCDAYDFALIFDEIQTAFGWLGVMTAMELYGVVPDLVSFGKGVGAGFPLAATLFTHEYDVLDYGEHEMTSGAHPVSCAASLAMLRYLSSDGCFDEIRRKGDYALGSFCELAQRHGTIGDVRGRGLLLAIEIVDPATGEPDAAAARGIFSGLLDAGVIMRIGNVGAASSVLQFKPPLVITDEELGDVFEAFDRVLEETAG